MSEQFQLSVTREEADYLKDLARWSILQGLKRKALPQEREVDGPPPAGSVLREELGAAVMLIGNNQFAQARKFLLQAYRLDQRCSLVNFLAALSTLRAFDAALEAKQ